MNNVDITKFELEQTMTLKEITDLLEVRHNDAMAVVRKLIENQEFGLAMKISQSITSGKGRKQLIETYQLNKRQSIAVAAKLNINLLLDVASKLDGEDLKKVLEALNNFEIPEDIPDMYVYAIKEVNTGNIKLGISKNPLRRLEQLQTGNSSKLELVGYKKAVNGFKDEKEIHDMNADKHLIGEWFESGVKFN